VVTACRTVEGELEVELAQEPGGAVEHERAFRLRSLDEESCEYAAIARAYVDWPHAPLRYAHCAYSLIMVQSASIAAPRALVLRHIAPM